MKQADDFVLCRNFINDFIDEYLKGNIYAFLILTLLLYAKTNDLVVIVEVLIVMIQT